MVESDVVTTGRPVSPRKPTSDDVARVAGVSQSTVSYVLTGRRPISEKTRRKVEQAIAELGFVPNSGARALAGRRSQVIGLVVPFRPGMEMAPNMSFVSEIAAIARGRDHDVLLATADEGPGGLYRLRDSGRCDGLILMDVEMDDPRVGVARELGIPCVVIGVPEANERLGCVDLDFRSAGADAIGLVEKRGHTTVGLLSPGPHGDRRDMSFSRRFIAGARDAAGRRVELIQMEVSEDYDVLAGAIDRVLLEDPGCSAFVVHLSAAVEPALAVLRARGIRPGGDVDVVGLCSAEVAARNAGLLDALLLQPHAVSERAMEVLFEQLADPARMGQTRLELIPAPVVPRGGSPII